MLSPEVQGPPEALSEVVPEVAEATITAMATLTTEAEGLTGETTEAITKAEVSRDIITMTTMKNPESKGRFHLRTPRMPNESL